MMKTITFIGICGLFLLTACQPNRDGIYNIYKNGVVKGQVQIRGDSIFLNSGNSTFKRGEIRFTSNQLQIYNYGKCAITFDYRQNGDTIVNVSNGNHARWVRVSK